MKEKYKVVIGLPSNGTIRIETAICIQGLVQTTNDYYKDNIGIALAYAVGSYIHENREIIALQAQKENATHLMFIDGDMMFPSNGLMALLEDKKLIVGANYNKRQLPKKSLVVYDDDKYSSDSIFECVRLPMGFTLIDMSVFEKIERPWFFFGPGSKDVPMIGEDYYLCDKIREQGIKIFCNPKIGMHHIGIAVY